LCEINDVADLKAQAVSAGLTDKEIKEIFGK
jgi:hypothetical protein